MQVGGTAAEQPRRVEVCTDRLGGDFGQIYRAGLQEVARQGRRFAADGRLHCFQVVGEGRERVLPCVTLIGHVTLHDRERNGLASVAAVLEASRKRRDLGEVGLLGEERAHLEPGVRALLEAAGYFWGE